MNNQLRIHAAREGGAVERCHGTPHHGSYSVGHHTFNAVSLLLLLHPAPTVELIKTVQWHDVAERWLGDVPSPAKSVDHGFVEPYARAEERVLFQLGLCSFGCDLPEEDLRWLKAVDILELWMWTADQLMLGNRMVLRMRRSCEEVLDRYRDEGTLPAPALAFYLQESGHPLTNGRLSDYWPEVTALLCGPDEAPG